MRLTIVGVIVTGLMFLTIFVNAQTPAGPGKLGYFEEIPKVITGGPCVGLFTPKNVSSKIIQYVLVTNIDKVALIKVDDKTIRLAMVENVSPTTKSFRRVYSGGGYKAILTTRGVKRRDVQGIESGTLEITHDKYKAVIKVKGEAKCK